MHMYTTHMFHNIAHMHTTHMYTTYCTQRHTCAHARALAARRKAERLGDAQRRDVRVGLRDQRGGARAVGGGQGHAVQLDGAVDLGCECFPCVCSMSVCAVLCCGRECVCVFVPFVFFPCQYVRGCGGGCGRMMT